MDLRNLLRKEVRVVGGGITYEGKLIEATEESILLKTDSGFVSVAIDRITSVAPRGEGNDSSSGLQNSNVSKSFFEFDPSE